MLREFEVFIPIPLSKAMVDPATGDWLISGPISTPRRDLQKDVTLTEAVMKGLETFVRLGMPVDFNHLSAKNPKSPKDDLPLQYFVGEGVRLFQAPGPDGRMVPHMEARLDKSNRWAQQIYEHLQKNKRLYFSIGGAITDRDGETILDTQITHVAITPYPANPDCVVGLSGLAKSLWGDAYEGDPDEELAFAKTLTAGSGPGFESTGARALIHEDLRGAGEPMRDSEADASSDTSRRSKKRGRRTRKRTMSKKLDQATIDELKEMETDAKLGPLAKCMRWIHSRLSKAGAPVEDDDDADYDEEPQDEEDEDEEDEEDERDAPPVRRAPAPADRDEDIPMGKRFQQFEAEPVAVPVDEFIPELLSKMDEALDKRDRQWAERIEALTKSVEAIQGNMETLQKSLGEKTEEQSELLKSINTDLEAIGMRPRRTGDYNVSERGGDGYTPEKKRELIRKGILTGRLTTQQVAQYDVTGEIDETLLKSLEG